MFFNAFTLVGWQFKKYIYINKILLTIVLKYTEYIIYYKKWGHYYALLFVYRFRRTTSRYGVISALYVKLG